MRCREKGHQPAGRQPQGKVHRQAAATFQEKARQGSWIAFRSHGPMCPLEAQIVLDPAGRTSLVIRAVPGAGPSLSSPVARPCKASPSSQPPPGGLLRTMPRVAQCHRISHVPWLRAVLVVTHTPPSFSSDYFGLPKPSKHKPLSKFSTQPRTKQARPRHGFTVCPQAAVPGAEGRAPRQAFLKPATRSGRVQAR